jgi:aldehyde:ferredoxin oxidoreductase
MTELYGWAGTVLHVDLTDRKITKVSTTEYEPKKFIGGVGLNTKIFWDMGCPKIGALDPGNPLMISVGPLTGLPGPFNRAEICGIGAQNYPEGQFTYSGFGGKFPSELKYAGCDAIVVTGKADRPACISIHDNEVAIVDAQDLWGLDIFETQKALMTDNARAAVLTIGPAGENLSRMAVVATETGSTAGQGGFGAVMGSKNLKAISVRGTGTVAVARPDEFLALIEGIKAKGSWSEGGFQRFGRTPLCGGEVEKELTEKNRKKFGGPYGCPFQCMGFYDMPGVGKGASMCASWWYGWFSQDPKSAWEGQLIAQKLGINHFELLGVIAIVLDTLGEDVLTLEDWDKAGFPSMPEVVGGDHTDHDFLMKLLHGIADGTGLFSEGVARTLDRIGEMASDREAFNRLQAIRYPAWGYTNHFYGWLGLCLHVAMDTRDAGNSTDGYLSFNRDGEHNVPLSLLGEHFGVPYGLSTFAHAEGNEEKANYEGIETQTVWVQHNQCLKNSLPICNFASLPDSYFHPPEMDIRILESKAYSAVTGVDAGVEELWKSGERIWNLRRAVMMIQEDRSREKDTYADAFFDVPWLDIQHGNFMQMAYIDKKKFEALKDRFYRLRGWDVRTGWPTRAKLEELDMKDVADALETVEKLPHPAA